MVNPVFVLGRKVTKKNGNKQDFFLFFLIPRYNFVQIARAFKRAYILSVMGIRCSEDFLTLICKVVSISVFTSTEI